MLYIEKKCIFICIAICVNHTFANNEHVIKQEELSRRLILRATVAAQNKEVLTYPVTDAMVKYLTKDGIYLNKDELVMIFDTTMYKYNLGNLFKDEEIVKNQLKGKEIVISNKITNIKSKTNELIDRNAVLEARRLRLLSMPRPQDVRIAEGQFNIARITYETAEKDYEKAQDRLKRGMISEMELYNYKRAYLESGSYLEYHEKILDYIKNPNMDIQLKQVDLEIENIRLEIELLAKEITKQTNLLAIHTEGATEQESRLRERVEVMQANIDDCKVKMPKDGYIVYLRNFKKLLARNGGFSWEGYSYAYIPDMSSIGIKIEIPENEYNNFKVGDQAKIIIPGYTDLLLGNISSIGNTSRDLMEAEDSDYGGQQKKDSGLKIYDAYVELTDSNNLQNKNLSGLSEALRIGSHVKCELISSQKYSGPTIPASYVKHRNGDTYISVNGVYEQVDGEIINDKYLLYDDSYLGKKIDLYGSFQKLNAISKEVIKSEKYVAFGEITPVKFKSVYIEEICEPPEITWLEEEGKYVKKNNAIGLMKSDDVENLIVNAEGQLQLIINQRKALLEKINAKKELNKLQLKIEENILKVSELTYQDIKSKLDYPAIYATQQDLQKLNIDLDYIDQRLNRIQKSKMSSISPVEIGKLKRDREQLVLRQEASQIKLDLLQRGTDDLKRKKAFTDLLVQKTRADVLKKKLEIDLIKSNYELDELEIQVQDKKKNLDRLLKEKASFTIRSPSDGYIKYEKVYNAGTVAKVAVGTVVIMGYEIMKIVDMSQLYVRVELPEKYFSYIEKGMLVEVELPSSDLKPFKGKVSEIEYTFESKKISDSETGLYTTHEPLGETIFYVKVLLPPEVYEKSKVAAGATVSVTFPFETISRQMFAID